MNNYILSIDPSKKNTGFTLGNKTDKCQVDCETLAPYCQNIHKIGKPIGVSNYKFDRYDDKEFLNKIKGHIRDILGGVIDKPNGLDNLTLYIERGFQGNRGSETMDHLRGNIFGLFNKLLTKDKLISPKEGQNGYRKQYSYDLGKGTKELSLKLAEYEINCNNGNININNDNDIADSLLIGGYVINVKLVE